MAGVDMQPRLHRDRGVTAKFLWDFLRAEPTLKELLDEWDKDDRMFYPYGSCNYATSHVVYQTIVPSTDESKDSYYLHALKTGLAGKDGEKVGTATVFVSHVWSSPFASLVEAIMNHDKAVRKAGGKPPYYWLDIFAINQHRGKVQQEDLLGLQGTVKAIGNTIAVIKMKEGRIPSSDLISPILPTRVWCLFEMFNTLQTEGATLSMAFDKPELKEFRHMEQYDNLFPIVLKGCLEQVSCARAQATVEKDRKRILAMLETSKGGFEAVDRAVVKAMARGIALALGKEKTAYDHVIPQRFRRKGHRVAKRGILR